jgi:hypothetical protein
MYRICCTAVLPACAAGAWPYQQENRQCRSRFIPTGAALGAEIRGVDLAWPIDDEAFGDSTLIASPGWTNWSREAGRIDKVFSAIGSKTDEGHHAAFILDLDGNKIEAVYRESKTA